MIGIAFTGSGKTLVFAIPLITFALTEETKLPFGAGEGPVGLCLSPSRELARQTYEMVVGFCEALAKGGYKKVNTMLCMGGIDMKEQYDTVRKVFFFFKFFFFFNLLLPLLENSQTLPCRAFTLLLQPQVVSSTC